MLSADHPYPTTAIVVFVDDEEPNGYVFRDAFENDFNVRTFTNPVAAERFIDQTPQVLCAITDHQMPEATGLDLGTRLKKKHKHISLLMVTANPENDRDLLYRSLRQNLFFDFFQKPYDFIARHDEFRKSLEDALSSAATRFFSDSGLAAMNLFREESIDAREISVLTQFSKSCLPQALVIKPELRRVRLALVKSGVEHTVGELSKVCSTRWTYTAHGEPNAHVSSDSLEHLLNQIRELGVLPASATTQL